MQHHSSGAEYLQSHRERRALLRSGADPNSSSSTRNRLGSPRARGRVAVHHNSSAEKLDRLRSIDFAHRRCPHS